MTAFCSFPGCDNPPSRKASGGLCNSHYWQKHKGRELTPLKYRRNRCVPWLEAHAGYGDDGCLTWPFQRNENGYAVVRYKGRQGLATRVMCGLAHGAAPSDRHGAAHSCGKGHEGCINPKHLRWALPVENAADKRQHGTHVCGEDIPWSFATVDQVRAIREAPGSYRQIGERFGLKPAHVGKIVRREIWGHVT